MAHSWPIEKQTLNYSSDLVTCQQWDLRRAQATYLPKINGYLLRTSPFWERKNKEDREIKKKRREMSPLFIGWLDSSLFISQCVSSFVRMNVCILKRKVIILISNKGVMTGSCWPPNLCLSLKGDHNILQKQFIYRYQNIPINLPQPLWKVVHIAVYNKRYT